SGGSRGTTTVWVIMSSFLIQPPCGSDRILLANRSHRRCGVRRCGPSIPGSRPARTPRGPCAPGPATECASAAESGEVECQVGGERGSERRLATRRCDGELDRGDPRLATDEELGRVGHSEAHGELGG